MRFYEENILYTFFEIFKVCLIIWSNWMKNLSTIILALLFANISVFANGLSLNSPGPVGLGMGGAYVGFANDLSTIYWNPAGITKVNSPQISVYYTAVMPGSSYKYGAAQVDAKSESSIYHVPGLFTAWPCMLMDDLYIGLGIFVPAGLGTKWNGEDLKNLSIPTGTTYEWESQIGAIDIQPTFAYKFSDMLSLGVGFNLRYGMFDLKRPMIAQVQNDIIMGQYSEESSGWGFGISAGLLFNPIDIISIGLSFKTENKVSFEGTADHDVLKNVVYPGLQPFGLSYEEATLKRDLSWPLWFGAGIAVEAIENLTLAVDVQYSQWSKTEDEIETTYEGWVDVEKFLASQGQIKEDMKENLILHWEDAMQIRFGLQYDINDDLALRLGYYLDPAPAPDKTLNILFPSNNYNALTFGCSYMMDNFGIDFGAEYLMGDERNVAQSSEGNMPGIHQTNVFAFSLGFHYVFGSMK